LKGSTITRAPIALRDRLRAIARAGVEHHDLVAEAQALQAGVEGGGVVEGGDDRAQRLARRPSLVFLEREQRTGEQRQQQQKRLPQKLE
jgi:hypothetical protein